MNSLQIKTIKSFQHKKFRQEAKVFIAEGPKIINDLLSDSIFEPIEIYTTNSEIIVKGFENKCRIISDDILKRISAQEAPQSCLAIFKQKDFEEPQSLNHKLSLVLDEIQNPGNIGTILRLADWFKIDHILLNGNCCEMYNPKLIQASMGSFGRVPFYKLNNFNVFKQIEAENIWLTHLNGENIKNLRKLEKGLIIIGNEGNGVSEELMNELRHTKVMIPRFGFAESLNAAMACSVLLSYLKL